MNNKAIYTLLIFFIFNIYFVFSYTFDFVNSNDNFETEGDFIIETENVNSFKFYTNEVYQKQYDFNNENEEILIGDELEDFEVFVFEYFNLTNNRLNSEIRIVIPKLEYDEIMAYGNTKTLIFEEVGDFSIEEYDTQSGDLVNEKTISAINSNQTTIIENVSKYLDNGDNLVLFEVFYNDEGVEEQENFEYDIFFNKYPNTINIDSSFVESYNSRNINISGTTAFEDDLYYDVNIDEVFSANRLLKADEDEFSDKKFTITLPVSNMVEGENFVRFITLDPDNSNIKTQDKKVYFTLDTTPPRIEFQNAYFENNLSGYFMAGDALLTNSNDITLRFSVDSDLDTYSYSLNNETSNIYEFDSNSTFIDIELNNLDKGVNEFFIVGSDALNNSNNVVVPINLDDEEPDLIEESLTPKHVFESDEGAVFQFEKISGETTKPRTQMIVFAIDENFKIDNKKIKCEDYSFLIENGTSLDNVSNSYNTLDLLTGIDDRIIQTQTDDSGKFSGTIVFDTKVLEEKELENKGTEALKLETQNLICFLMIDAFRNINIVTKKVKVSLANPMWSKIDVRTIPNTLYSAEIEQSANSENVGGSRYEEATIISRFRYTGYSNLERISSITIGIRDFVGQGFEEIVRGETGDDRATYGGEYGNFVEPIQKNEISYRYVKDENILEVVFPIRFKSLGVNPSDYPDSFAFTFKMLVDHDIEDKTLPTDSTNPVYFSASFNIERPIDMIGEGSLLSPKNINATQRFLNKSIDFTERASSYLQTGSLLGLGACLGAKIWHTFSISGDTPEEKDAKNRKLFRVCDRVACQVSPDGCDTNENQRLFEDIDFNSLNNGRGDLTDNLNLQSTKISNTDDEILGEISGARAMGSCTLESGGEGYFLRFEGETYKKGIFADTRVGVTNIVKDEFRTQDTLCYNKTQIQNLNPTSMGLGVCYSEEFPYYDDTKAWWPGMGENGFRDNDPKANIYESIKGACITDTYSHTKNYLKLQKDIYQCLEQAKIGEVRGGYCQRLMAQAVCDIATNVLLPAVKDGLKGRENNNGIGDDFSKAVRESNELFENRYRNSIFDNSGNLGTTNLYNKACIAGLTGDLSLLTDDFLMAIESNEVEPIFGPPLPESRIIGYNPLTGKLTTQYRWTEGAVSGGSDIKIEYELICDRNGENGEYCPKEYVSKVVPPGFVTKGASTSQNRIFKDEGAKYWYNYLKVTRYYSINKDPKQSSDTFRIIHKSEVPLECDFSLVGSLSATSASSAGFVCSSFYNQNSQVSRFTLLDETDFIPKTTGKKTYYNGEVIQVNLALDVRGEGDQNQLDLHYGAECVDSSTTLIGPDTMALGLEGAEDLTEGVIYEDVSFSEIEINKILGINDFQSFEMKKNTACKSNRCDEDKDYFIIQTNKLIEDDLNVILEENNDNTKSLSFERIAPITNICNNEIEDIRNTCILAELLGWSEDKLKEINSFDESNQDSEIKYYEYKKEIEKELNLGGFIGIDSDSRSTTPFFYKIKELKPNEDFDKITFNLENLDDDLDFQIFSYDDDNKKFSEIDISKVDKTEKNIRECNLYLRVLPSGAESFSSIEDLKNYSSEEESNIIQSDDILLNNYKTLPFQIREKNENDLVKINIESPKDSYTFNLENSDKIPIEIYSNKELGSIEGFKFEYVLSNKYYDGIISKTLRATNLEGNHPKYSYNITKDKYEEVLNVEDEKTQEIEFRYKITYKEKDRERVIEKDLTLYGRLKKEE